MSEFSERLRLAQEAQFQQDASVDARMSELAQKTRLQVERVQKLAGILATNLANQGIPTNSSISISRTVPVRKLLGTKYESRQELYATGWTILQKKGATIDMRHPGYKTDITGAILTKSAELIAYHASLWNIGDKIPGDLSIDENSFSEKVEKLTDDPSNPFGQILGIRLASVEHGLLNVATNYAMDPALFENL